MQSELIDAMQKRVRTIYRAMTGTDLPDPTGTAAADAPVEEVTRRFVALETLARTDPVVAERVPPFSFTPRLDAMQGAEEITVEVAVPGVDRADITVGLSHGLLVISGFRHEPPGPERPFAHAEIARGPFYREFRMPWNVQPEPAIDLDRGLLRIQLKKAPASSSNETSQ